VGPPATEPVLRTGPCSEGPLAACEAACDAHEPGACYSLARDLEYGFSPVHEADDARAARLYAAECDRGVPAACDALAGLYALGLGVSAGRDMDKALALYGRACDENYPQGCVSLGWQYFYKSLSADEAIGVSLFRRACDLGGAGGCFDLSVAYKEGKGIPKDVKRAVELAARACAGGVPIGCVEVGSAKVQGEGIAKDVRGGLEQLDDLCSNEESAACNALAGFYDGASPDVPEDPVRATSYAKEARRIDRFSRIDQEDECQKEVEFRLNYCDGVL
jgi:uncharacterized protein